MTKVAAEYGVTSTALKKTCNRHKIPTPERGYWAKLEHDKPVRRVSMHARIPLCNGRRDRVPCASAPAAPSRKPLRTALGWKMRREMTQAGTTAASGRKRLTHQKRKILNYCYVSITCDINVDRSGYTHTPFVLVSFLW
jgi:hypothetical protein